MHNLPIYIFFGVLIAFVLFVAASAKTGEDRQRVECTERGGEYVQTGRSRYLCMAKECLK